jgi:hypothetical protein
MRETTLNRGQGATNFMEDVSMLKKLGVHIIFARIVGRVGKPETHIFFLA